MGLTERHRPPRSGRTDPSAASPRAASALPEACFCEVRAGELAGRVRRGMEMRCEAEKPCLLTYGVFLFCCLSPDIHCLTIILQTLCSQTRGSDDLMSAAACSNLTESVSFWVLFP